MRTREYKNKEWLEDQYINQKKTLRDNNIIKFNKETGEYNEG